MLRLNPAPVSGRKRKNFDIGEPKLLPFPYPHGVESAASDSGTWLAIPRPIIARDKKRGHLLARQPRSAQTTAPIGSATQSVRE